MSVPRAGPPPCRWGHRPHMTPCHTTPVQMGGTGQAFDWELAARISAHVPFFLAGGTPLVRAPLACTSLHIILHLSCARAGLTPENAGAPPPSPWMSRRSEVGPRVDPCQEPWRGPSASGRYRYNGGRLSFSCRELVQAENIMV